MKKDVLLLADVFENFIDTCLKFYKLDPCHYFISPGLSWGTMLKMTGVKLEKISNIDMYLFIEKGLRGGISYIAKRYSKANNKYMKNFYDMLSDYCKQTADEYGIKVGDVMKLIPNLGKKTNYVPPYKNICISEWNWLKFIKC